VVRGGAGFHAHQAERLLLEEGQHLTPPQLAAENHTTLRINAMDLINVLRKIDTNRDNVCHRAAPISLWFMKTTILAHFDAGGWEPSTASKAGIRTFCYGMDSPLTFR
jgi:hypothetical protein